MAATLTKSFFESYSATLQSTRGGVTSTFGSMSKTIAEASPKTIIGGDSNVFQLSATASTALDVWPQQIAALATGYVIHFRIQPVYGSLETTMDGKEISVTINAEVVTTWGTAVEFDSGAVTTVTVTRENNGSEIAEIEVIWYVYNTVG
jgi:hypothetical protein